MLVIRNKNPNLAERELIDRLEPLDGVAFVGYIVAQGEKEREIDVLLFTPVRAAAIEVKGPQLGSPSSGELIPYLNAPWTINGEIAKFHGGSHPNNQARVNAQIFAQFMKDKNISKTPFVQSVVVVSGDDLVMPKGPKLLGQTATGLTHSVIEVLDILKKRAITLETILEIIDALDLGPLRPSNERVAEEWANAEALQGEIEGIDPLKTVTSTVKKALAPYPQEKDKSSFQRWISKAADWAAIFVAIFLFVFFLQTITASDFVADFSSHIWHEILDSSPSDPPTDKQKPLRLKKKRAKNEKSRTIPTATRY
jgi:hypothetical protein